MLVLKDFAGASGQDGALDHEDLGLMGVATATIRPAAMTTTGIFTYPPTCAASTPGNRSGTAISIATTRWPTPIPSQ